MIVWDGFCIFSTAHISLLQSSESHFVPTTIMNPLVSILPQRVSLSRFAIIASSWLFPARPRERREKEGERGSCRKAGGDELIWECSSIWKLITVVVDGNPCVPRKAGYCVPSLGCGGVPLDDTTVEQSQEHLIVTRWRTSGRPAHAGNALPTDFVYTQAGREIVAHIVTSVCCGACSSV